MKGKGFSLIELIIVITIIGILAAIAIPAYVGQQKRAARTEAYTNLETLRLLEEQFFAESATYTASLGACAADNDNIALIQAVLPGFRPGTGMNFSYCIEQNIDLNGNAQTPCFRASAFGNTGTRVEGDTFRIDCNNNRNF
ncbi:MAG: prepilin-type N-terminal cleavage/methylation domain-containing protein [Nitrospirae bacterium]|nr:prepilin-type N-terminal cleavage/methylation domain-containing protein [Nitrospirota bacterium]